MNKRITVQKIFLINSILKYSLHGQCPMDIVHWTYARKAILFGIPKIFINSITSFYKDIYLKNIQDKFCFNVLYVLTAYFVDIDNIVKHAAKT